MAQEPAVPPSAEVLISAEVVVDDDRGWAKRFAQRVWDDAPAWLLSLIFHMGLLIVLALLLGRTIVQQVSQDAPSFETDRAEQLTDEPLEHFDLKDVPADPSELTTESLTMKGAGFKAAQEALVYNDAPVFEEQGGGSLLGKETGAGGLGFDLKASGLGPELSGAGGAELGKGAGTGVGRGGEGTGFGGRGKGSREALLGRFGGTKQTERAVAGALNWLARHQNYDGSWSLSRFHNRCRGARCSGGGSVDCDAAATALGLLPFLAAGQTHLTKGPYQKHIASAVQWLILRQQRDGDLGGAGNHQMYAHGLAAIALCEAYGMSGDRNAGRAAQAAVNFTLQAQNARGGWRYTPGAGDSDTSVFGWQMMALKSAVMAGLSVDPARLELGRKWLDEVSLGRQDPKLNGQFSYQAQTQPTPCMSAVALLILQYTGSGRKDPVVVDGVKYLMANPPSRNERNIYYWYYATQIMHNISGPDWDTWNRQMRHILVEDQVRTGCAAGSWDPEKPVQDPWGALGGRLMLTSLSALTLEVYYRYLPLYKLDADRGKAEPTAPIQGERKPTLETRGK